ncbi:MAG: hypothetical protein LVQ95_03175 [Candidatus Micrarchaeales archaeon]|nr:hypothetical protein [Candidatus Micrarchaeales archaeon]
MLNGKAKALLKKIKINRKLEGIKSRAFHHSHEWGRKGSAPTKIILHGRIVSFTDVFSGFEGVSIVKRTFGKHVNVNVLFAKLKVGVFDGPGYVWVDEERDRLMISKKYLENGMLVSLYLDVIHELIHFKQHIDGKDLWDERYDYVDRPTEVEAYRISVKEAKRLGMNKKEIARYLYMKWLTKEQFKRLLKNSNA